jgi:hypothetical protein
MQEKKLLMSLGHKSRYVEGAAIIWIYTQYFTLNLFRLWLWINISQVTAKTSVEKQKRWLHGLEWGVAG